MRTLEAVEALAERARQTVRRFYALAAVAMIATGGSVTGLCLLAHVHVKVAAWTGAVCALALAPVVRVMARAIVKTRRLAWIEELARAEGISAEELARYFTLDSW